MTNKELWQYFQLFLEVEGALGSYKYYLRKGGWRLSGTRLRGAGMFSNTFTWSDTKQGRKYWSELDLSWQRTLRTLRE